MQKLTEENATENSTRNARQHTTQHARRNAAEHSAANTAEIAEKNEQEDAEEHTAKKRRKRRLGEQSFSLSAGAALVIGCVGAVLACVDMASPLRAPFTFFFLVWAPASAIGAALHGIDPLSRPVLAVAGALVIDLLVAQLLLALQMWSARGGVVVVGVLSLLLFLLTYARRWRRHLNRSRA
ncbi:hypothetical protein [Streptomyces zagrosensis]|uniref:Uncharacterized protein n=1 Tax=Streptomyces zagrosensis TaxID=1042984 RepID=A0A7W9Q9W7_9ACTN|nr:hypothetical protein [Streptomyces zagrosensis]MBB5936310.1 hypothetical protein [Streptomyces zagrosensis]